MLKMASLSAAMNLIRIGFCELAEGLAGYGYGLAIPRAMSHLILNHALSLSRVSERVGERVQCMM